MDKAYIMRSNDHSKGIFKYRVGLIADPHKMYFNWSLNLEAYDLFERALIACKWKVIYLNWSDDLEDSIIKFESLNL